METTQKKKDATTNRGGNIQNTRQASKEELCTVCRLTVRMLGCDSLAGDSILWNRLT